MLPFCKKRQQGALYIHSSATPILRTTERETPIFILIELGSKWKPHIYDCINQIQNFTPRVRIVFVFDDEQVGQYVRTIPGVEPYLYHKTKKAIQYQEQLGPGLNFGSSWRFVALYQAMKDLNIEQCIHMEHDNLLCINGHYLWRKYQSAGNKLVIPRDSGGRCIASLIYVGSREAVKQLVRFFVQEEFAHSEMNMMSGFMHNFPAWCIAAPVVPPGHPSPLNEHFDQYGGVFDAAAIGQWLGGVDPIHEEKDTRGFINESADYSLKELEFRWGFDEQHRRVPVLMYQGVVYRVFNLHIHCKRLHMFLSSYEMREEDIVQGEKFRPLADQEFHTPEQIQQSGPVHGPVIYVKTDLLESFLNTRWNDIVRPVVFITHNADHGVHEEHRVYLDDTRVKHWFAQNATLQHPKLTQLPIGLANSEWPHGNAGNLCRAMRPWTNAKKLIYVNFGDTHPHRKVFRDRLREMVTRSEFEKGLLDPASFLVKLASFTHVASPQGNGADTHRFWEALYLGVLPVLANHDHGLTPLFPHLPQLDNITDEELSGDTYRYWLTFPGRSELRMSFWKTKIFERAA